MNHPGEDLNSFPSFFVSTNSDESLLHEMEAADLLKSDLHDENFTMMLEVYGSNFQQVWKKTRKKWWA